MKTKHLLVLSVASFLFTFCSDPQIEDANTSPTSSADLASFGGSGGFGPEEWKGEGYNEVEENPFIITVDEPVSTFSIDAPRILPPRRDCIAFTSAMLCSKVPNRRCPVSLR